MLKLLKNYYFQAFLFLFFFLLIKFYPLFLGKTLFFGDNYSLMVPGKIFTAFWLKQGVVPLWNPTIFAGISWIGDINQSLFYPSTLLFVFFKPALALNLNLLTHLFITGLGMYGLAREIIGKLSLQLPLGRQHFSSLLAMVIWVFSLQMSSALNNISFIQTLAWMPVVVWVSLFFSQDNLSEKAVVKKKTFEMKLLVWFKFWLKQLFLVNFRLIFLFAGLVTLQMTAGYPQFVLYSVGLAFLIATYFHFSSAIVARLSKNSLKERIWQWLALWLGVGFLSVLLSAPIWLPFMSTLLDSTRFIQSSAQAGSGSLQIIDFIKTFVPHFFENSLLGMKWGSAWNNLVATGIYLGWLPLILVVFSATRLKQFHQKKDYLFFATLFTIFTLLALGENLPGFNLLKTMLPILKVTRTPSNFLIISVFIFALWAGVVFANLKSSLVDLKKLKKWGFLLFGLASLFLLFLLIVSNNFSPFWSWIDQLLKAKLSTSVFHTPLRDQIIFISIFKNIVFNLFLLSLTCFFWARKKFSLVILLVGLDLIYATSNGLFFSPKNIYDYQTTPINQSQFSQIFDPQYRTLTRNYNSPYTDFNFYFDSLVLRQPFSDSYINTQELQEFEHLQRMRAGMTPDWNMTSNLNLINGFTTLMPQSVSNLWNTGTEVGINNLSQIKIQDEPSAKLLSQWAVKYYLVDTWFPNKNEQTGKKLLLEKDFWQVYGLESLTRFRYENDIAVGLEEFSENPNEISFIVNNLDNHQFLIVADRYEEPWKASVNGRSVTIENYQGMRKIPLEVGLNKINVKYSPFLFYLGLGLSLITSFISILIVVRLTFLKSHR